MEEKRKVNMFGIVDDFDAVFQLQEEAANSNDEAIQREAEAALEDFTKELLGDLKGKADGYAYIIQATDNREKALKAEAKRLTEAAKVEARKRDSLKSRLFYAMDTLDMEKIVTDTHKFSLRKNGGALPVEVNVDAQFLPTEYRDQDTVYKANKTAIREALVADPELVIEGCKLLERGRSLSIK